MSDYPPPPPPPSPYQPGPVAQQASRNGLGIAAVILGIIGVLSGFIPLFIPLFFWVAGIFGIIGLMLGLVGYGRFQRGAATNGTMALWGIITSAVAVVLSIVGLVILLIGVFADLSEDPAVENESTVPSAAETSAPAQEEETAPTEPEQVDVFGLEVGDCLADPQDAEEVFSIETLPCSEPHSEEVFAAVTIPEGDGEFPGFRAIDAQAEELCIAEFEDFVGRSYQQSVLDFWFITPSEETWGDGDREVLCTVYDPAGDTTGTLADSNR